MLIFAIVLYGIYIAKMRKDIIQYGIYIRYLLKAAGAVDEENGSKL